MWISIHAPSRERRLLFDHFQAMCGISIHAPSRERLLWTISNGGVILFQSTLPRGSDPTAKADKLACGDFNPRSLAGATTGGSFIPTLNLFQSTLPRGSDVLNKEIYAQGNISIHAPSRERLRLHCIKCTAFNFNPRSLAGAT